MTVSGPISVGNVGPPQAPLPVCSWNACGVSEAMDYDQVLAALPNTLFIEEGKATAAEVRGERRLSPHGSWIVTGASDLHRELGVVVTGLRGSQVLSVEQFDRSLAVEVAWQHRLLLINSHLRFSLCLSGTSTV